MSDPISTTTPSEALARGEVYLFLARAFMYPTEPLQEFYGRAGQGLALLGSALPGFQALEPPGREGLEALYQATFTHTTPAECPPYETQYGQGHMFRQSQALAELAALYRAFGLKPTRGERLDHLGTQLEFVYFLCYKEAYALLSDNGEGARRCREGEKHFLEQHLGRWAPLFLERLGPRAEGFYAQLATATGAWLAQEMERLQARPSPLGEEDLLAAQRLERFFDRLDQSAAACEAE